MRTVPSLIAESAGAASSIGYQRAHPHDNRIRSSTMNEVVFLQWNRTLLLHKSVAAVRIVVDPVLLLQFLDVSEGSLAMRTGHALAERLVGVEQDFLEAATERHMLVLRELL